MNERERLKGDNMSELRFNPFQKIEDLETENAALRAQVRRETLLEAASAIMADTNCYDPMTSATLLRRMAGEQHE